MKEKEQQDREQILNRLFQRINEGTAESAIQTVNNIFNMTRQVGVLTNDFWAGDFSKIASDTVENTKNTDWYSAAGWLGARVYDAGTKLLRGAVGAVASDAMSGISNLVSAGTQVYAGYQVLIDAGMKGALKAGLLERLAETKLDRLDAIIDVIIKNPLTTSYKKSLGLTDQDLKEYLNLAVGIIQDTPSEKRKELSANLVAFMSSWPDERQESSAKLIDNIFDIASTNHNFRGAVQTFLTQVCEHKNSGRNPPSVLDKMANKIKPYKGIIEKLNIESGFNFMQQNSELTEFVKKMFIVVSVPKITTKMDKYVENKLKLQQRKSSLDLAQATIKLVKNPNTVEKLIDIMDIKALKKILELEDKKSYKNQAEDAYKKLPGFLEENKEQIIKEGLIKDEKEYQALLNQCKKMQVNQDLEEELGTAPNLASKMKKIIDSAASIDNPGLFRDLAPTIRELANDTNGLESISNSLNSKKEKIIELLNAVIESPQGEYLRMAGITGEELHKRLPKILTPKGINALADFMEKPSFATGMNLATKTKSFKFACNCIIKACKNYRNQSQTRERSKSVVALPSVKEQYDTRQNNQSNTLSAPCNVVGTNKRSVSTPGVTH